MFVVSPDGSTSTAAQVPIGGFETVSAIAVGPDGDIYLADDGNHRVRRLGSDGSDTTVVGSSTLPAPGEPPPDGGFAGDDGPATEACLNLPLGLVVATDGTLYIADAQNGRIRRVGADGVITSLVLDG